MRPSTSFLDKVDVLRIDFDVFELVIFSVLEVLTSAFCYAKIVLSVWLVSLGQNTIIERSKLRYLKIDYAFKAEVLKGDLPKEQKDIALSLYRIHYH